MTSWLFSGPPLLFAIIGGRLESSAPMSVFVFVCRRVFPTRPAHREGETRSRSREFPVFSMSVRGIASAMLCE